MGFKLVLSSAAFFDAAPGLFRSDTVVVPETFGVTEGATASHRYEQAGVYPLQLTVVDNDDASGRPRRPRRSAMAANPVGLKRRSRVPAGIDGGSRAASR